MFKNWSFLLFLSFGFLFISCRKSEDSQHVNEIQNVEQLKKSVLYNLSAGVISATYNDLGMQSENLHNKVLLFTANANEYNLNACKQAWKDTRAAWEQSEGFLFGPVQNENIDPQIDTWPINYVSLDSLLASNAVFTVNYMNNLEDALKGFHPIEYLLFGKNGEKNAQQFTARENDFLIALCFHLKELTNKLSLAWNKQSGDYFKEFTQAGTNSIIYKTKRAAYEELMNGIISICDELANSKIKEPYLQQDPSMEESPFAHNSIADFKNNILSVQSIYIGKGQFDDNGLEDLVKLYNLSLDGLIKQNINNALLSLNQITLPFGEAIIQQPLQIQQAIKAIDELKDVLESDLLPFIQQNTND